MKKRSVMIGSMLLLVVLLIGGGTFAWFTASADPVVNEFTAGTVDISIHDIFEGAPRVNPGDCYSKIIYVENTGTKKAYIRIKADTLWTARSGVNSSDLSDEVICYGINNPIDFFCWNLVPGWTYEDGYFYYNKVVDAGCFTAPLLKCNRVCFAQSMGNEYQGAKLDITINADAIQGTHNAVGIEWGVHFPVVRTVEAQLTQRDVDEMIAAEEAAFEALELE